ncbi:MAG: hypothetical protein ACOYYF_02290 [Chloroflexota bacterium]|nr:Ig-like domain-containing protein [Chloroflexota bacterium]
MKRLSTFLILLALLLGACSAPGASLSASGVQSWLDQPISGSILPLGAFPLKAHARHADGSGITRIEFLVNGVTIGAVDTNPAAPIVYAETNWNASAPGEYNLTARAYAGSAFSDSAPARVCVLQEAKEPVISQTGGCDASEAPAAPAESGPTEALPPDKATEIAALTATALAPTFTPPPASVTPPPTFTPVPPTATFIPPTFTPVPVDTTPPVVDITYVDPPVLYYGQGCSTQSGILTVEAYVSDGQSGVGQVYLAYGFTGAGTEGIFTEMTSIGSGYYRAVIDIGAQAYNFYQGANGSIGIAVIGNDGAGNSAQDTAPDVPLIFCPG